MYFYEQIKKLSKNKKTRIYVDMDGVIASYDFGKPLDFINKRPLITNIKTLSLFKQSADGIIYKLKIICYY